MPPSISPTRTRNYFRHTCADGEPVPGATMSFEEKLEIAEMLDDMGPSM